MCVCVCVCVHACVCVSVCVKWPSTTTLTVRISPKDSCIKVETGSLQFLTISYMNNITIPAEETLVDVSLLLPGSRGVELA